MIRHKIWELTVSTVVEIKSRIIHVRIVHNTVVQVKLLVVKHIPEGVCHTRVVIGEVAHVDDVVEEERYLLAILDARTVLTEARYPTTTLARFVI